MNIDDSQMKDNWRIADLLVKYLQKTITREEQEELDMWKDKSDANKRLFADLTNKDNIDKAMKWLRELEKKKALKAIKSKIEFTKPKNILPLRIVLIAASVIAVIAITALVFFQQNNADKFSERSKTVKASDVAPGGNKATLKLGDGKVITLNGKQTGLLKNEKGTDIIKTAEGELTYHLTDSAKPVSGHNVLSTPAGGQYAVLLPDGSRAWLNASSSLTYPVSFGANERKVSVTGEVYFEVKKEKAVFVVESESAEIKVLGTHFNLSAYKNEVFTTTLLEGSVFVTSRNNSAILKRGQEAKVDQAIYVSDKEHPEDAIAWKKGHFRFNKENIKNIMRQLERWYDIEVKYEGDVQATSFTATVSRYENISTVLKLFEKAGGIHFLIEGRTITVKP